MMRIRSHVARCLVTVSALFGLAAACSSADPEPEQSEMDLSEAELGETSAPLERGGVETRAEADVTLAEVRLSLTHTVKFTESADGSLEVYEDLHADRDAAQRRLADIDDAPRTLADIHRYLLPGTSVPAALVQADARAAARVSSPDYEAQPPDDAFASDGELAKPGASAVAWDWNGDASWFSQNFYTGGTAGYFAANATWVTVTKKRWTSWYKATAFNQSFDSSAHFRVDRSKPCGFLGMSLCWDTKVSEWIANRSLRTYLGTGSKYRKAWLYGSGPDPRVGLAVRWVLDGGAPPPGPSVCGGHNQLVCSSGQRCQAGLVEYNGGCYGCGTVGQSCCKDWSNIPTPGGWQGSCVQGYCGYPGGYCQ
ncbi:hypothetical protein [Sorangium sp. So ce1182]|uniref:hypothetical protein n=1 Tax=Sorangium sp. So ce1182 TaxID=3133334 RepID=UPI003F5FA74E